MAKAVKTTKKVVNTKVNKYEYADSKVEMKNPSWINGGSTKWENRPDMEKVILKAYHKYVDDTENVSIDDYKAFIEGFMSELYKTIIEFRAIKFIDPLTGMETNAKVVYTTSRLSNMHGNSYFTVPHTSIVLDTKMIFDDQFTYTVEKIIDDNKIMVKNNEDGKVYELDIEIINETNKQIPVEYLPDEEDDDEEKQTKKSSSKKSNKKVEDEEEVEEVKQSKKKKPTKTTKVEEVEEDIDEDSDEVDYEVETDEDSVDEYDSDDEDYVDEDSDEDEDNSDDEEVEEVKAKKPVRKNSTKTSKTKNEEEDDDDFVDSLMDELSDDDEEKDEEEIEEPKKKPVKTRISIKRPTRR